MSLWSTFFIIRIGVSIVVMTMRFSLVYNKIVNNPQCFLLYSNTSEKVPLSEVTDVSINCL